MSRAPDRGAGHARGFAAGPLAPWRLVYRHAAPGTVATRRAVSSHGLRSRPAAGRRASPPPIGVRPLLPVLLAGALASRRPRPRLRRHRLRVPRVLAVPARPPCSSPRRSSTPAAAAPAEPAPLVWTLRRRLRAARRAGGRRLAGRPRLLDRPRRGARRGRGGARLRRRARPVHPRAPPPRRGGRRRAARLRRGRGAGRRRRSRSSSRRSPLLVVGALAWLLLGGRRREGEKYAGLRILR